ncbi:hypothetical protein FOFC_11727 [Fusarium oxysporum]|nr:hypothetical protein FOFC_11727 [Fusarium oxysporum]
MIPASDIYQSSPDWIPIPVVYYHYYSDLLDTLIPTTRISIFSFTTSLPRPKEAISFY